MENQTEQLTAQELALVLGCEAETKQKNFLYVNYPPQKEVITGLLLANISGYEYIKPFLRKLEDLSENEKSNLVMSYENIVNNSIWHTTDFVYLLSLRIDLFNWCEQGKALHESH